MDVREKLALSVCNATQKTNFKCEFNCEKKGKCAYCLVMADQMIANGVTVQEWKPISEPPKEKGTYLVCTDNGGVLLGHWYGTAWNAGGGAKKHLAYWMEKPQPPKGE